jgi:hypothetical protein
MLKFDLFNMAMHKKLYGKLAWVITAFSISEPLKEKKDCFIYSSTDGHRYYDEATDSFVLIDDADPTKSVFEWTDVITLQPENIINLKEPIETTYGNWLVNYLLLVEPFHDKIPYMEGDIEPPRIEAYMLRNFAADPVGGAPRAKDVFYVSEYLKYVRGIYYLTGFSQISVWAATRKSMLPPPGVKELRDKLLKENEGHTDELVVVAKIEKELVDYDKAWLAGDPSVNFLLGGKALATVRKKKFLISGAETGLTGSATHGTLIGNSLIEGWDISKFPELNTSLRAASYSRGAETQLGGVSVKWLLRSSSNMNIAAKDCGSTLGVKVDVTPKTLNRVVGFSVIEGNKSVFVKDEEQAGAYLGKSIRVRSPKYCQLPYTDFCETCLGKRLSINKDGLSLAVSEMGSTLLKAMLARAHGSSLSTAKMDFKKHLF